jgi:hypothetical protein
MDMMQYVVSCVQAFDNEVWGEDRRLPVTLNLAALVASTIVCIRKLLRVNISMLMTRS